MNLNTSNSIFDVKMVNFMINDETIAKIEYREKPVLFIAPFFVSSYAEDPTRTSSFF